MRCRTSVKNVLSSFKKWMRACILGRMWERKSTSLARVFFKVALRRMHDLKGRAVTRWKMVVDLLNVDKEAMMTKLRNSSDPHATEKELQELMVQEKYNASLKANVSVNKEPKTAVQKIMSHSDTHNMAMVLLSDDMSVTCIPALLNARITNLSKAQTYYQNWKDPTEMLEAVEPYLFKEPIDDARISIMEAKIQTYSDELMSKQKDFTKN